MSDRIAEAAKLAPSASLTVEEVRSVRHWNEHLFSFTITRPPSFRFIDPDASRMSSSCGGADTAAMRSPVATTLRLPGPGLRVGRT